jgi:hypothetical protein
MCFLEYSQTSPACLYNNKDMQMKMSMGHWCNDTDSGKQKVLGGKQLSECYFADRNPTDWSKIELRRPPGKTGD